MSACVDDINAPDDSLVPRLSACRLCHAEVLTALDASTGQRKTLGHVRYIDGQPVRCGGSDKLVQPAGGTAV